MTSNNVQYLMSVFATMIGFLGSKIGQISQKIE